MIPFGFKYLVEVTSIFCGKILEGTAICTQTVNPLLKDTSLG